MAWFARKPGEQVRSLNVQRARMIDEQLRSRGIADKRVLAAMMRVRREEFVPPQMRAEAYVDEAMAISHGQTISQPYMVAVMSQELGLRGGERVLEIGTGSGYQTAILAELVGRLDDPEGMPAGQVRTVERIAELSEAAQARLTRLGYRNISFRVGDGSVGWPEFVPYDAVLLTAAAPDVPAPLIEQLAASGRFVGPIGSGHVQTLVKWAKTGEGEIIKQDLFECRFVRLIGSAGWEE